MKAVEELSIDEYFKKEVEFDYEKYIFAYDSIESKLNSGVTEQSLSSENSEVVFSAGRNESLYNNQTRYEESRQQIDNQNSMLIKESLNKNLNELIRKGVIKERLTYKKYSQYIHVFVTTSDLDLRSYFPDPQNDKHLYHFLNEQNPKLMDYKTTRIGDKNLKNPKVGTLILRSTFEPKQRNLINLRYQSNQAKDLFECANAHNFLNNIDIDSVSIDYHDKIDIETFFSLKYRLTDIGIQSEAFFDTKSSIIDGPAGSGKSTIALQKLNYLHKEQSIPVEKMAVIVKNSMLINHFKTLTKTEMMNIQNINIFTVNDFVIVDNANQMAIKKHADAADTIYQNSIKKINYFDSKLIMENINYFYGCFEKNSTRIELAQLSNQQQENERKIIELRKELLKNANLRGSEIDEETFHKNDKLLLEKIKTQVDLRETYKRKQKNLEKNAHDPEYDIYKLIYKLNEYSNHLKKYNKNQKLNDKELKAQSHHMSSIEKIMSELTKHHYFKNILSKMIFSDNHLNRVIKQKYPDCNSDLIFYHILHKLMKYNLPHSFNLDKTYDTVVVDEAQDFTPYEIELIRLRSKRIILTGDIVQNFDQNSFKKWNELILNFDEIFAYEDEEELKYKIFNLEHNFRQTYQLANASFNFRQLLLKNQTDDLRRFYYQSQIEFNNVAYKLPLIKKLSNEHELSQYVSERIDHISQTYSAKIPIAIIYKTDDERNKLQNLLSEYSTSVHEIDIKNVDILFVHLLEAKGKEFPIVMCNIDDLNDNELYLVMSRAQFELDLLSYKTTLENPKLKELYKSNWIELDSIVVDELDQAIDQKNNEDLLQNQNTTTISNDYENESLTLNDHQSGKKQVLHHNTTVNDDSKPIIEPSLASDMKTFKEAYQKTRETKLRELAERSKSLSIATKKIVVKEKILKIGADETKDFFRQKDQYAGHCQICGFSFKTKKNQYYCERFTWTDYKKGKWSKAQKELLEHKIIDAGNSLCLCAKCHSVIKQGGDFEAKFLNDIFDRIGALSDDEILQSIQSNKMTEVPEIFRNNIDFNDMYALPIRLLGKQEHLYFTEIHLIQFIEFLKS